ncbi:hypothetical protein [Clavibacter zhangzhiyongii]|uniref:hypothetical protein n=1 Tax=Clavibacter zhangzhiyongii TaxID=2768071 RepID=UPI00195C8B01|nr:hypothetical protein [Clavibacter zhangzhiyongii]MBM7026231.1 hypothetical protein [Clavibacter zhangzhiyongii]
MVDAADGPGGPGGNADVDAIAAFVRALATSPWPRDAAEAERMLADRGAHPTGEVDAWSPASARHALSGGPDAVAHLSYATHAGEVTSVGCVLARHGGPHDPAVRRDHDDLVAALTAAFGASRRPFDDQPSPILWDVGELEVGVQVFDRVDSSVMAWVDHRERAARQERAAGEPGGAEPA